MGYPSDDLKITGAVGGRGQAACATRLASCYVCRAGFKSSWSHIQRRWRKKVDSPCSRMKGVGGV